jgi:hypothetical protein
MHWKTLVSRSLFCLVAVSFATQARAGLFDGFRSEYDPTHGYWPHFEISEPSSSEIQVVTPPSIDRNGNIWSGSGSGGRGGSIVGKARLQYSGDQAYWVSNYRNRYGRVRSPVRAPQHDRKGLELDHNRRRPVRTVEVVLENRTRELVTYRLTPANSDGKTTWVLRAAPEAPAKGRQSRN